MYNIQIIFKKLRVGRMNAGGNGGSGIVIVRYLT